MNAKLKNILYLLIMSCGIIVNICLYFIFKKLKLFSPYYPDLQSNYSKFYQQTNSSIPIVIFIYTLMLFHKYSKRLLNIKSLPNDPNQEEITLYYRRYKLWRFIFDHKLSHNPEIRIMQQKLIRKKELFQKISNISVNMAFIMMIVPELVIRKNYFNIPSSRISNYEFVITCILSSLSLIIIFSGLMFYKTIIQKNVLDKKDQSNTEIQDNSIYEKNQKNLISNNEEK